MHGFTDHLQAKARSDDLCKPPQPPKNPGVRSKLTTRREQRPRAIVPRGTSFPPRFRLYARNKQLCHVAQFIVYAQQCPTRDPDSDPLTNCATWHNFVNFFTIAVNYYP